MIVYAIPQSCDRLMRLMTAVSRKLEGFAQKVLALSPVSGRLKITQRLIAGIGNLEAESVKRTAEKAVI